MAKKAEQEPTHDEVREILLARYPDHFSGENVSEPQLVDIFSAYGKPPAEWHDEAFKRVHELRKSDGLSIVGACNVVGPKYIAKHNISAASFIDQYKTWRRDYFANQFAEAVLSGDLERAVDLYFELTPNTREQLRI